LADIVVIGSGATVHRCRDILDAAGFRVGAEAPDAAEGSCPAILGDVPNPYSTARHLIEAGRDVLLASPAVMPPGQVELLFHARQRKQAVFVWQVRRYHPGYRLVSGLAESDEAIWRPRLVRQYSFSSERASSSLLRWRAVEALSLVVGLTNRPPSSVTASEAPGGERQGPDFLSLQLELPTASAFIHVGLSEGVDRRETTLVAPARRAYIDETNPSVPVRLIDDELEATTGGRARWVSCPSPTEAELIRQQCLAFLEAIGRAALAQAEADLWLGTLASWRAAETSLSEGGVPVDVRVPEATGLRLILGSGRPAAPALSPLSLAGR
jgi:predicted dehydrogenase